MFNGAWYKLQLSALSDLLQLGQNRRANFMLPSVTLSHSHVLKLSLTLIRSQSLFPLSLPVPLCYSPAFCLRAHKHFSKPPAPLCWRRALMRCSFEAISQLWDINGCIRSPNSQDTQSHKVLHCRTEPLNLISNHVWCWAKWETF